MQEQFPISATYTTISAADLAGLDLPRRGHVLEPWLPERGLALLHGPRGIGKTHLVLAIAHAVATGGDLLQWFAPTPRRVLVLDGEMPAEALQERLAVISAQAGSGPSGSGPPENLRFLALDLQPHALNLADFEHQEALEPHLAQADLIIVDNLSTLTRYGRENEAESWLPIQVWALAQRRAGRAVLFVHHSGKAGQQRGTSRREDVLDTVLALRPPAGHSPERGARFEIHMEKHRYLHGGPTQPLLAAYSPDGWTHHSLADPMLDAVAELTDRGWPIRAIATQLGLTRSTVWRLQSRARDQGALDEAAMDLVSPVPPPGAKIPGQDFQPRRLEDMTDAELRAIINSGPAEDDETVHRGDCGTGFPPSRIPAK